MKKNNLLRFFKLSFKKNKVSSFIAFLLMVIVSGLGLLIPQLTRFILDDAVQNHRIKLLINSILIYIGITLIKNILSVILDYVYSIMKNRVSLTFKIKLLRHLAKLSGKYYSNIKTGNILNIMENDMYIIESLGSELLFSLIVDFFTAIISLFFLLKIQHDLLIIIVLIQLLILFSQSKFTKLIALKNEEIREKSGDISNISQEYISNIMNIVISKSNFKILKQFLNKERSILKDSIKLDMLFSKSIATGSILNNLITVAIYGYGGYKIIKGSMTFGDLIAFQQYTGMFISPCMNIIRSNIQIQQAITSINRIFGVLDEPIEIYNNKGIIYSKDFKGDVCFNNVSFSYEEGLPILNNINLSFKHGQVTALVGASGCGKSTIVNLLFRLWDVDKGKILLNNIDIKDYNLKSLRKNISIVTQDLLLFDDSILNNLTLGNKNINKEYVEEICKKIDIYRFIEELPNGFNTIIGEKGVKLSGGQKQRIAIARALISNSSIIIFDEATSALDNISQKTILENINELLEGKTVILIAHRLSTIKNADKIYVIDKGKVIESGTHKELTLNKSIYYNLANDKEQVLILD
ncbi:ABC transporter ATP-binding protein [[Clostridium] sordellii]|uniref:ABC transporter ATP-binding protein n=1 Tax=Paraclostridium sordellii TaxID=1505 RepID=UPI0005E686FB|nr:ABC transporter ATP-binding protein [Paeniclostridium sordellii]CEP45477.1 ABC transporter ATP-binding protein [[Clostridium] sordellii] [Paeniclostridium sordellii]